MDAIETAVFQLRELLLIVLPVVLVAAGTIWFALRLVDLAPPGVPSYPRRAPAAPTIAMPNATRRPSSVTGR
jgi:hypothetical protein